MIINPDPKPMSDLEYKTLSDIASVQAQRRANWSADGPVSDTLEARHQAELKTLREQLLPTP
jgi:hypothetical protein